MAAKTSAKTQQAAATKAPKASKASKASKAGLAAPKKPTAGKAAGGSKAKAVAKVTATATATPASKAKTKAETKSRLKADKAVQAPAATTASAASADHVQTGAATPATKGNGHVGHHAHHAEADPRDRNEHGQLIDAELLKVKTGLKKKQIAELRAQMLEKRAELIGDVSSLDAARQMGTGGDLSHMPLHMADVGSDAYQQEFSLGLMETERKLLDEIDEALLRLHRGIYGVCLISGIPIPLPRLEAKPWAKYCIEVVRQREKMGLA